MRLTWIPASRVPRPRPWALAVVTAWGLLVAAGAWVEARAGIPLETCLFRRVTGHPCPTCGGTRMILALLHGRFVEAAAFNPFLFVCLLGGASILGARLVSGRAFMLEASAREQSLLLAAGVGFLLLNWAWVWPRV